MIPHGRSPRRATVPVRGPTSDSSGVGLLAQAALDEAPCRVDLLGRQHATEGLRQHETGKVGRDLLGGRDPALLDRIECDTSGLTKSAPRQVTQGTTWPEFPEFPGQNLRNLQFEAIGGPVARAAKLSGATRAIRPDACYRRGSQQEGAVPWAFRSPLLLSNLLAGMDLLDSRFRP